MEKKNYKNLIGDGKTPNKYWVFHYDQKFKRIKDEDGNINLEIIKEDNETTNSLIGEFDTYQKALNAVNEDAYLPHIVIEDRISGQVFEQICIVCQECGKEEYETYDDIHFTKKTLGNKFR
jgi:hypothetical protein